jgi:hypothetical protein
MSRGVVLGAAATVAVVAVGSSLLAGRASEDAFDTEAIAAADPIRFDVFASGRGVRLGIDATYPGDRQLSGGRVTIDGDVDEGLDFWSEKYDDHFPKPDPFPVAAGTRVLIEREVIPSCDGRDSVPVITLESRLPDGTTRSDSYRPSNLDEYRAAAETYCHLDPEVEVAGSRQEVNGDFTVTLTILNPTRKPAMVASGAFQDGDTTWEPASITVPPQGSGELVLHGHGEGCSTVTPWTTGNLTVNGVAPEMDEAASEQC